MSDLVPYRGGQEEPAKTPLLTGELQDRFGVPVFPPKAPVFTRENLNHAVRGAEGALLGGGAVLVCMAANAGPHELELANKMGINGLVMLALGGLAEVVRRIIRY